MTFLTATIEAESQAIGIAKGGGSGGTDSSRSREAIVSITALADCGRSARFFASKRMMRASSSSGMLGFT